MISIIIFIFLLFCDSLYNQSILPDSEYLVYETNDKGKIGTIQVTLKKDTLGYHIIYTSDRIVEAILDTLDLQTLFLNKIIKGRWELSVKKNHLFEVNYRGRKNYYEEKEPVYDRHTLDFVLRIFPYHRDFRKRIRLNVPEFMIINADLEVVGDDNIIVPVGSFDCWRIMMVPRVVFTNMKFYFYIEKSYPHRFVKYNDSSGKNSIILKEYR